MFCRTAQHVNTTQRSKTSAPRLSFIRIQSILTCCTVILAMLTFIIWWFLLKSPEASVKRNAFTLSFTFKEFSALFWEMFKLVALRCPGSHTANKLLDHNSGGDQCWLPTSEICPVYFLKRIIINNNIKKYRNRQQPSRLSSTWWTGLHIRKEVQRSTYLLNPILSKYINYFSASF